MANVLDATIDSFYYPDTQSPALADVRLQVEAGEFVVITGPAGAGKTTLCYCLTGVIPKAMTGQFDGRVSVCGQDLSDLTLPRVGPLVSMVLQNPDNQLFNLTVYEDVAFGPENLGLPPAEVSARAEAALAFTGTSLLRRRFSHLLSGGQSQRVVLSSVVALGAGVLVLDQPAAELDPAGRRTIYENIHRLNREAGKTIIVVEDRLSDVAGYASRIVLMEQGRIIRALPPREFFADPALAEHGVRIPDSVVLYHALQAEGHPLPQVPLTVDEAVASVAPLLPAEAGSVPEPAPPGGPAAAGPAAIEVRGLVHRYPAGVVALEGVDLTVRQGEFVAIVGENGAGKTTLAKHLIGLLRPTAGTVAIMTQPIARLPVDKISRWLGYLFQDPDYQIFNNSCLDEVAYGLRLRRMPPAAARTAAMAALDRVGLAALADAHPYTLSRGQRQRLAMASILALHPPVLVVDEPSTGLDYRETVSMMQVLEQYRQDGGTVLVITHDMDMALRFARRIVVMAGGRIRYDLPVAQIPAHLGELEASAILLPDIAMIAHRSGLPSHLHSVSTVAAQLAAANRRGHSTPGQTREGALRQN